MSRVFRALEKAEKEKQERVRGERPLKVLKERAASREDFKRTSEWSSAAMAWIFSPSKKKNWVILGGIIERMKSCQIS